MPTTIFRAAVALLCLTLIAASDRPTAQTPSRGKPLSREELAKVYGRVGIVTRQDKVTGQVDEWLEGSIYNDTDRVIEKVVVLVHLTKGRRSPEISRKYALTISGLVSSIQPKTSQKVFARARFTLDEGQKFTWSIVSAE